MSLVLTVDGDRWRTHLRTTAEATPGLVPVIKGNGYGFTPGRLARRAAWLGEQAGVVGLDTVAVGTYDELPEVAARFAGDLLVMTPWRPGVPLLEPALARRVIHTVSRPADLPALLSCQHHARYVLELLTSMRRHGMTAPDLWALAGGLPQASRMAGIALHLPLQAATGSHLAEVERLITDVVGADLPSSPGARTVWVSHLTGAELARLRTAYADLQLRPRLGTDLWLGDRGALRVGSTVLDVHPLERGQAFGYRGRSAPRDGHLVVVSGGTAHGIGLEAPHANSGLRDRAATVARGSLDALGLVRSPFWIDDKQRLFAEPPHMQVSMLFLPAGARTPAVGDVVEARVRYTATHVDQVSVT